ncbi:MAG TPA: MFS transporter [Blastocatellia bacterium]|nr:MFS transporter [Blastocatellia bacterium]
MKGNDKQRFDPGSATVQNNSPARQFRALSALRLSSLPRNVIALGLVSLFNDASSEIIYPLLPLFITSTLGASVAAVGLIEGVAESTSSLLKLFAGWLSDRLGHRKLLVVAGYGTASLIRPLLALAASAWQVLGLRFIDRIGKGIRSSPRDAMIADAAREDQRGLAFGFHRAMDHTGAIVGSLAGAWLALIFAGDYRRVFWMAAIPALAGLLILILAVREQREPDEIADAAPEMPPLAGFHRAAFNPEFKKFLGILALFTLTCSSDAFLLLRAQQSGISAAMIPLLWALLHVTKALSSLVGGGLSDRLGRRPVIISGWMLYAAIYCGFAFCDTSAAMWTLFAIYGFYFGLTEGVEKAMVTDLVAREQRGTAFGLYHLVIGITALPASLILGLLWQSFGAETALLSSAVVSLIAAGLLMTVRSEQSGSFGR